MSTFRMYACGRMVRIGAFLVPRRRIPSCCETSHCSSIPSVSSTIASTSPLSLTDGQSAAGERFLADASARLAESLDVLATIQTLSELAVESFADGCRITLLDEDAQA